MRPRATARRAAAIGLIRLQCIQELQQVTWSGSSPVTDFAAPMSSSIRHLWGRAGVPAPSLTVALIQIRLLSAPVSLALTLD